ncbi:MAG: tyrosine-type recombinase/integrase [Verrucomicrobia bacterium]|nr:tyrosine-type recombinase/integrase [Verrucomicrobiota bacterium]
MKRKPQAWPRKVGKGRNAVRIYRRTTPSGKHGYLVSNCASGDRKLESFPDPESALARAEILFQLLAGKQVVAGQLSNEEASEYLSAKKRLPEGLDLLSVVQTCVEAVAKVGSLSAVIAAAEEYARRHGNTVQQMTVADAVAECIAEKERNGMSVRYIGDLHSRLGRFADAFKCNLASIRGPLIAEWLDGLKIGLETRANYRRILQTFFSFCQKQKYLPKGWDELECIPVPKINRNESVEIFLPDELRGLFENAHPDVIPVLVFGAFCGMRTSEIARLTWDNVKLDRKLVIVTKGKVRSKGRRNVPLCDAAIEWLLPHAKESGKVWTRNVFAMHKQLAASAKASGFAWRNNALRHSFISYRVAGTKNIPQVAIESGNSVAVIHKHYLEIVSEDEAQRWFNTRPPQPAENVIALSAAVNA